jgi:hypothetical protein
MPLAITFDQFQARAYRECQPGVTATYPWGRGSGKTTLGRLLLHTRALEHPGKHVGLLMPTLKHARQVYWPHLFADFDGPLKSFIKGRPNKTLLEVTFKNGSRLTTWGAENAGGIRGQRFDVLIEDETDDIDPEVEQAIVRPTFSRSGVNALWVKFGTPRRGRAGSLYSSHAKALRKAPGYVGFSLKSSQSPQVDQAWLRGVAGDTPPDIYSREYDVNFDAAGGRVWGGVFNESFHVRLPPDNVTWQSVFICCDHGWEDPGCLLLVLVRGRGRDATAWVIDEVYARHRTEEWWKTQLRKWTCAYPQHKFYGDPSMPARIEAYRRDCGAHVQDVDNSIEDGIAAVADKFLIRRKYDENGNELEHERFSRLYVSPRCVNLLTELGCEVGTYLDGRKPIDGLGPYMRKRNPDVEGHYLEEVEDKNNHASDALRYGVLNFFGGPDRGRNFGITLDSRNG